MRAVNAMRDARRAALRKCAGGVKLPKVRLPRLRGEAAKRHRRAVAYLARAR